MTRELTCIGCPMGCTLTVEYGDGTDIKVTGNTCNIGPQYAQKEITDPRRIVTSTVRVKGGSLPVVSVKTQADIPKKLIFDCIAELSRIEIDAPVNIGDVIIENVLGTGVNIVATQNVESV